jgi:hypothetical protein
MRLHNRRMTRWVLTPALVGFLTGCGMFAPSSRVLYQEGRTVIQLEKDPSEGGNTHPAAVTTSQMAKILDGVLIQQDRGLAMSVFKSSGVLESAFNADEIELLAPLLSKGLQRANPSQRVGFMFWSPTPGRGYAAFSGAVSVRDPYLIFILREHPGSDWQDSAATPLPPSLFALDFRQASYLKPGSDEERKGSYRARPTLQIDYRRYLAALDGQSSPASAAKEPSVAPAASAPTEVRPPVASSPVAPPRDVAKPDSEAVKELQRRVKDLNEELVRLKQEIAETKQLLADKVLELNRLKTK